MKGRPAPTVTRKKHKSTIKNLTGRRNLPTKRTPAVPQLCLEKLKRLPTISNQATLLRTKRIEQIPSIEVTTDLKKLQAQCFMRSARLAPKDTSALFKRELLKQYAGHLREILIIQRQWRCYRARMAAKHRLKAKILQERRLDTSRQNECKLLAAKKLESEKWKKAAELLKRGSAGKLPIATVMQEIKRLCRSQDGSCNPEEEVPSEVTLVKEVSIENQNSPASLETNVTSDQPTNPLEFRLYSCESKPQKDRNDQLAEQIYDFLFDEFSEELRQSVLFSRMFTRDSSTPSSIPQRKVKFAWEHIMQCSELFFRFVRKFCLQSFMRKFSEPYGLSPRLALKSIRGDLSCEQLEQHNLIHQPLDDEMLLLLSEFICKRFRKGDFGTPKSCENRLMLESNKSEQMETAMNVNSVLTAIIEIAGSLKPFGNGGKPPLESREHFPTISFSKLQQTVNEKLSEFNRISLIRVYYPFMRASDTAYLEDLEKEWKDDSAHLFESAYVVSMEVTDVLVQEMIEELYWCFKRQAPQ